MTNTERARRSRRRQAHPYADRAALRGQSVYASSLPDDALVRVTGGEVVPPAPRPSTEQPPPENKSWARQAGEFVRDASGGFTSGLLGFSPDEQLWGKHNRVSDEFGGFGEFLGTRAGGRRVPRR